ncbi:probable cytochrome P450 313b1 [Teleopsis dalmanni]|uniref:probable cytochrome P450 313b1 n=1 Tax=Teleopsis dalmanni TaxID=139649 RepID=UPI0018CD7360|nr:probable cytochrome P450 313b1 [Teleopsis dalmanni]
MSAISLTILGIVAFSLWIYFLWSRRRFYKIAWQLPGPPSLPLIGMGLNMMNPETLLPYLEKISEKYKTPFISWMGINCVLYVNDPNTMEKVFNSPHCTNKGDFYRFMSSAIGDGLFTSSSPRWNKHRRLINPAFSRQILDNFLPIFNTEANVLLKKFGTEGQDGKVKLEIYEMLKKSVLEAACQTTMGKKMDFHNDGSAVIFESYNILTEVCARRMLSPWLYPDILYQYSSLYLKQKKVVNVLFGFIENLLSDLMTTQDKSADEPANTDNNDNDIFVKRKQKEIFIEQMRNNVNQGQFTWKDVRDEANVTIAATFETTSTALYIVCLCLAMHPESQEKLYAELVEIFPDNSDTNNIYHEVTSEHLQRMTYTETVINEAMRLFAPVPVVIRRAMADFELPNGVVIPKGTQIVMDIFNMQRNKDIWGSEAHSYRPDLHFGPDAQLKSHPFAFVPFTKGVRMCIGYRYALMLMKVVLAKIFRNYRLQTDAKIKDINVKCTISLKLHKYPLCTATKR